MLREFTHLDLTCPMPGCHPQHVRHLILESSNLKLKDARTQNIMDVHCFLFTDVLLICKFISKKTSDKVRIIRQPFRVDRIVTKELKDGTGFILVYLNEFNVACYALTLYCSDTKIWMDNIGKAQEKYKATMLDKSPEKQLFFHMYDEQEEYDLPSTALLVESKNHSKSSIKPSAAQSAEIINFSDED